MAYDLDDHLTAIDATGTANDATFTIDVLGRFRYFQVSAPTRVPPAVPVVIVWPAEGSDCSQRGWADFPTWSSSKNEFAFFAAPQAVGADGPARGLIPSNLYVAAPGDESAKAVLSDVVVPRGLAYAPDGQRLAFGGEIAGTKATWIFDRVTGHLERVYEGRLDWLAWSPDGTRLVGLQFTTPDRPGDDKIVIVPLVVKPS